MNKKGFTLAELMGVIIILGTILLLTLPAVDKIIKNAKETSYNTQIENIIKASSDWALQNPGLLPRNRGDSITIYLSELKLSGGIDINIKNPKTGKIMSNNTSIVITKDNNKYTYNVNVIDVTNENNENAPILVIDGDIVDYVEVNQNNISYNIPSASAKTATGTPISNSYITYQVLKNGNVVSEVDTSSIGTYVINYTVTYEGETGNYQKTVIVRDTTKPEITISNNISINVGDSINLIEGVVITDNSGEEITPVIRSTISNIPGSYYVFYTATDSSGNSITKRREVIVNNK